MELQAAIASRTDEPSWAQICLDHLVVGDGDDPDKWITLKDCFPSQLREISKENKSRHLSRLHATTGIPYDQMCFFDNEHWNIEQVSQSLPDVKCYYTPDGMTRQAWDQAKADFGISEL